MNIGIGHMGIGRTGAAVYFVKQALRLQDLDILSNRHLRHAQFVRHVGDAHETVFIQVVEDILVSLRYA